MTITVNSQLALGSYGTGGSSIGGYGGVAISFNETPSGTINGVNKTFTITYTPTPATSLQLFYNGQLMQEGAGKDYALTGTSILFNTITPANGDVILATYQYGVVSSGGGTGTPPTSVSISGSKTSTNGSDGNTTFTLSATPTSWVAVYLNGIRLKSGIGYNWTGGTNSITAIAPYIPAAADIYEADYV